MTVDNRITAVVKLFEVNEIKCVELINEINTTIAKKIVGRITIYVIGIRFIVCTPTLAARTNSGHVGISYRFYKADSTAKALAVYARTYFAVELHTTALTHVNIIMSSTSKSKDDKVTKILGIMAEQLGRTKYTTGTGTTHEATLRVLLTNYLNIMHLSENDRVAKSYETEGFECQLRKGETVVVRTTDERGDAFVRGNEFIQCVPVK